MDLGTKVEESSLPSAPAQVADGPKVNYPGFSLNDDKVREFLEEHPVTMGDTITFTGKAKVTGMSDQRYGTSLQFDLLSMDGVKKAGDEEEEEGEEESPFHNPAIGKMLRRKRE